MNRPSDEEGLRRLLGGANDETDPETLRAMQRRLAEIKEPIRIPIGKVADDDRIAYLHLRVGPGAATAAFRRDATRSGVVYVGVGLCAPADQFSRKRGRLIASGRLACVEMMARSHVAYPGLGFIFATGAARALDKEVFEAFESWINDSHRVWPLWLQRFVEDRQGCQIAVAPWASIMGTRAP